MLTYKQKLLVLDAILLELGDRWHPYAASIMRKDIGKTLGQYHAKDFNHFLIDQQEACKALCSSEIVFGSGMSQKTETVTRKVVKHTNRPTGQGDIESDY